MIVLHHTRHPFVIAALFSGVRAGIALGNEYVVAVYIMRFRPIRYGWGPGRSPVYCY